MSINYKRHADWLSKRSFLCHDQVQNKLIIQLHALQNNFLGVVQSSDSLSNLCKATINTCNILHTELYGFVDELYLVVSPKNFIPVIPPKGKDDADVCELIKSFIHKVWMHYYDVQNTIYQIRISSIQIESNLVEISKLTENECEIDKFRCIQILKECLALTENLLINIRKLPLSPRFG